MRSQRWRSPRPPAITQLRVRRRRIPAEPPRNRLIHALAARPAVGRQCNRGTQGGEQCHRYTDHSPDLAEEARSSHGLTSLEPSAARGTSSNWASRRCVRCDRGTDSGLPNYRSTRLWNKSAAQPRPATLPAGPTRWTDCAPDHVIGRARAPANSGAARLDLAASRAASALVVSAATSVKLRVEVALAGGGVFDEIYRRRDIFEQVRQP
jgi:hypothetical protein